MITSGGPEPVSCGCPLDLQAKQSEARQQTIMERYLVRRHNARLLKQGLDALRESCSAAKKKVRGLARQVARLAQRRCDLTC